MSCSPRASSPSSSRSAGALALWAIHVSQRSQSSAGRLPVHARVARAVPAASAPLRQAPSPKALLHDPRLPLRTSGTGTDVPQCHVFITCVWGNQFVCVPQRSHDPAWPLTCSGCGLRANELRRRARLTAPLDPPCDSASNHAGLFEGIPFVKDGDGDDDDDGGGAAGGGGGGERPQVHSWKGIQDDPARQGLQEAGIQLVGTTEHERA